MGNLELMVNEELPDNLVPEVLLALKERLENVAL